MIQPIFVLFFLFSAVGLAIGLWRKNVPTLFALNILWWLGAFGSAYYVYLAWMDRIYSENWALMGFLYISLPYTALTVVFILIALFFTRRWDGKQARLLRVTLLLLLLFLALQTITGFIISLK